MACNVDEEEIRAPFPRLSGDAVSTAIRAAEEVVVRIHQRRAEESQPSYEVGADEDGKPTIPMSVRASTLGVTLQLEALQRSPWLERCLSTPIGSSMSYALGKEPADEIEEGDGEAESATQVVAMHAGPGLVELVLPTRGAGAKFLSAKGFVHCLETAKADAASASIEGASQVITQLTHFMWAVVLGLATIAEETRRKILKNLDTYTVALILAAACSTGDPELLRRCYWCLRESLCGASGVPCDWLEGPGPVKMLRGTLSYKRICRTPLRVLASVLEEDVALKQRWYAVTEAYTLCQVYRTRQEDGGYPHVYEVRLDHSGEVLLTAIREDEQAPCRIFASIVDSDNASEHCEEFLGSVVSNFWGTDFTVYDSGVDRESLLQRSPSLRSLPVRPRAELCKIGYTSNIMGECPRKIAVDVNRDGVNCHMENIAPRWDKKLNSYALPFFGRVKKASAKNFQLVVDADPNTIFLIFGKISKDVFCLDFRSPLSPLDAVAIASTALAKKRAVS
mmetsp:Transcript_56047/g.133517  ORF Transcript_56047/g.133517 Transcript_56047/m.133517 type:complete len:508 (+) Transcript_56047:30-1553(+)